MKLYDPNRPRLANGLPTWLNRNIAISHFELRPLENGNLEISIWLPLRDETFATMRFSKTIEPVALHGLIQNFLNDPEATCEFLFQSEPEHLQPELKRYISNRSNDLDDDIVISKPKTKKIPLALANIEF
jgi:hypothetical protein